MNVFVREINANARSLIIWSLAMVLMIASSMGKYAGLVVSGQSINELMAEMPESLKAIMGVGTFDLTTVGGYYGVLHIYLLIIAAAHAVLLGTGIISKEERDKTAEFLFVKPRSRSSIITSKLAAALVNVLIINIVTTASSIIFVNKYGSGQSITGDIATLMIGMFVLQLTFLFIGTANAAIINNPGTSSAFSIGILLGTFILSILIDINSRIEILKYLTPFKYFDAKNLLYDPGFERVFLVISTVLIIVLFYMTYNYRRRDLKL